MTRRCLDDDLGLAGALLAPRDAREFCDEHPAVKKFVAMRGAAPDKGEPIHGPFKRGVICSLHVGSARAVTAWDEVEDVCWLLGYQDFHRNGEPDDAYRVFVQQYCDGVLLPTEDDYLRLTADADDAFYDFMLETGRRLIELARANPGREQFETFDDGGRQVMCVDILVEDGESAEEGWVGITLPDNEVLSDTEVFGIVAQLLPPGVAPIYETRFRDRERRRGEVVYRWEHYVVAGSDAG